MLFTTSWDDGHPSDLRLAALLQKHGFKGTFYTPIRNREGKDVMGAAALRQLAQMAEVGSHTLDHCYLNSLDDATARAQIHDGRRELEQAMGQAVAGFCYPGGKFESKHLDMVKAAGFTHARTIQSLMHKVGRDPFRIPTTLQFYPHKRATYLRNWLSQGAWLQRAPQLLDAAGASDLPARLRASLLAAKKSDGMFHIWGHSWELESFGGWEILDEFLAFASEHVTPNERVTNAAAARFVN